MQTTSEVLMQPLYKESIPEVLEKIIEFTELQDFHNLLEEKRQMTEKIQA